MKILLIVALFLSSTATAQMHYTVSVDTPYYHVQLNAGGIATDSVLFKMPVWTPGYYQLMNYAEQVYHFSARDTAGNTLPFEKRAPNGWMVYTGKNTSIILEYDVKSTRPFVAANFLSKDRGYISPAGMFMHISGQIKQRVTLVIKRLPGWNLATSLYQEKGKEGFYAVDFDILYDSPILMGKLEELPDFKVGGIPHYFVAYNAGEFDQLQFIKDLQKIVQAGVDVIGEVPYTHYTFLAIGPGGGGIEHLNSASISFNGAGLQTREGKIRIYNFLAHEYFHHYNVKRIRPIELGPFDYDNGSKTRLLWISEGFTVYYEYLMVKRAGLTTPEDVYKALSTNIRAYESKPGRLEQSVAAASYETWADGPFGRSGGVSYYDKGPVIGAMLDLKIRHETNNKRSLDDVMRALYQQYYKQAGRGFTEAEFRTVCEKIAGVELTELFEYANTVKPLDYRKYFGYAGLELTADFELKPITQPNALQIAILKDWLR
ncbi:M61 family metallopeptidase [Chitinophaga sp. SYP-B3965]|uniref:M61 family metallopeptidase n=1 Tax=Chitinophaga sp. SYP-B3965 TaxID=2663120 RepID=UPI00156755D7|nr:M61 family metallopeptidase [Chitinophaga sp. SYP-B3965]